MTESYIPSQRLDPFAHGLAAGGSNLWMPYLGPPPRENPGHPFQRKDTSRWTLPDVYVGKSEYLADTVVDYALTSDQSFWTTRILPWHETDQLHVTWMERANNVHYMTVQPETTSSRVISQKVDMHRASIVRRGIAMEFTTDFIKTPEGRESFVAGVAQMGRAFIETANVECLRALVSCHRSTTAYVRKFGIVSDFELDRWHERQINRFMCAQKDETGLIKLGVEINSDVEKYGGRTNCWIIPREVADFANTVPAINTQYYLGGQQAVDRLHGRSMGTAAADGTMGNVTALPPMIGDSRVYLAKSHYVENIGHADMMKRTVERGIYNLAVDRCRDHSNYRSESRTLRVYNETTDQWSDLELSDMIEHCGIWADDGTLEPMFKDGGNKRKPLEDLDWDFLSRPINAENRQDIQYIGDMGPSFLTTDYLIKVAYAALNSLTHGDKAKATQLLGDPLQNTAQDLANGFFGTGIVGNSLPFLIRSEISLEPHYQAFLKTVLASIVTNRPDQTARLNAIAANEGDSWEARANAIGTALVEIKRNDSTAISAVDGPEQLPPWVQSQIAAFRNEIPKLMEHERAKQQRSEAVVPEHIAAQSDFYKTPFFERLVTESLQRSGGGGGGVRAQSGMRRAPIGSHLRPGEATGSRGADTTEDIRAMNLQAVMAGTNILRAHFDMIGTQSQPEIIKALAQAYLTIPFTKDQMKKLARANIPVPLGFLLMRPHATFDTLFGIRTMDDGSVGMTAFGHGDMDIGWGVDRKVGLLHYTTFLSAIVQNSRNVYVVEDLFCRRYHGGMGVAFWSRNAYRQTTNRFLRDIICAPLPPSVKHLDSRIDIRGRWITEHGMQLVSEDVFSGQPHYPGAARMSYLFGFHEHVRKDVRGGAMRIRYNTMCCQGMEWYYNTKMEGFVDFTIEQSHFGPNVYPGCGKVRNGGLERLKEQGYNQRKY